MAPIKLSTIPRLELLAIHTCAKLAAAVTGHKADAARWHTFVFNCVSKIQSMLPTTDFIHVPSEANPADLFSHGMLATQFVAPPKFCIEGPSWLGSSFPVQLQTLLTKEEARHEVKPLTVLTWPSNLLVEIGNFQSPVKFLSTLFIGKVAFKKDLKATCDREEIARALHAVVKQVRRCTLKLNTAPSQKVIPSTGCAH